ncbi:calcium-binding protein 5-like isoform X2 [Nerophis ophidion]|uniref:calcium-binding protein 5-like isoform X2 n=1 Tax=Nerophis ophidion TaxID=159077 RepID=UPI002AE00584|nr:calcium-binding protein 5-like isoform X2 [Nerophis ophidion]XP_061741465.1 calcium-binding protein 5-like isoform X2 [Nerophis ophidion]XP_061741466.1 calcium-binding protein 5-like isoform X2 [Nerophis ophidion]XP_061741467.1 calcium-binding protein 5-like isoform X2 [Nerophis ophidion]XP_061741468.1 calcium-binding protein 5-like isoform X2 [Nerophis ophidion]XP_061741469.1 calcium-binding protein 5-like isoform X2 [Nerophis ophidion]XP_061741470.1 calcium-binding protein 5-like isoform
MSQKQACIFLKGASRRQRTLTHEEVEELREAFVEFDKDKDGFITCKDLGNLMRTMGYMPTKMELIQLSQNINMNLGGRVDFEDFLELMTPKLLAETAGMIGLKELKEAFREFDIDGDGCITSDELRHAMVKFLGAQTSKKEIDAVVREADSNGDGTVDFEDEPSASGLISRACESAYVSASWWPLSDDLLVKMVPVIVFTHMSPLYSAMQSLVHIVTYVYVVCVCIWYLYLCVRIR